MKAKLIKTEVNYLLENKEGVVIASTSLNKEGKSLSKQNCDEIFGVVDVKEVIAENMLDHNIVDKAVDFSNSNPENNGAYLAYIAGASEAFKAMKLNKDKVFSREDMEKAIQFGLDGMYGYEAGEDGTTKNQMKRFIQSLQQPTEIEVEIEMEPYRMSDFVEDGNTHPSGAIERPKLDSSGNLILKKT